MMAECFPEMSVWRSTEQMCLGLKCNALGGGRERGGGRDRGRETESERERARECLTSYLCFLHHSCFELA